VRRVGHQPILWPHHLPNLAAWWRFNTGITVTGQGVSEWADQSGNARHQVQGTDGSRPPKQADGSILFNGSDEFLAATFNLAQPWTLYFLGKQITWTATDQLIGSASAFINQRTASPQIGLNAGSALGTVSPTLDTYFVLSVVGNGASSLNQLNYAAPVTGNAGTGNLNNPRIGCSGAGTLFSHIQVKEVILFSAAHDAITRKRQIDYLRAVVGMQ
jgi:hypothetical protein